MKTGSKTQMPLVSKFIPKKECFIVASTPSVWNFPGQNTDAYVLHNTFTISL